MTILIVSKERENAAAQEGDHVWDMEKIKIQS
jgi:hypothetical protein